MSKHRHAGTLVLVGWYLMVPPIVQAPATVDRPEPAGWLDYDAPISQWQIESSWDTAAECQKALAKHQAEAEKKWANIPITRQRAGGLEGIVATAQANQAKCIATDDPRLKGTK